LTTDSYILTSVGPLGGLPDVEIYPEFNYEIKNEKIESTHVMWNGVRYGYKWGQTNRRSFELMFVTSRDRETLNTWWNSKTNLLFKNSDESEVFSCSIINDNLPIGKIIEPLENYYKGELELGDY